MNPEQMLAKPARRAVFSAARIAELMVDDPEQAILPTPEQTEIIEQPLGASVLVIAGAGSGKTETMANRVVWLVANGLVHPAQILGLTFTRKAAGELGERVSQRLQRFSERLDEPSVRSRLNSAEAHRADEMHTTMRTGLELPEVSTYNAFASAVVQEFGGIAGVSSGGVVIDEAVAWGIARDIVCASEDPGLSESEDSIGVIVKHLTRLDHAVAENLTKLDDVLSQIERVERIAELPYNEKKRDGLYAPIRTVLKNQRATRLAIRLADRFSQEKRRRGVLEFSDQLALAVETLQRSPEAIRTLRERTPVVLLDEVQDTSVGQSTLLALLFRGASVMAVGDPHQSIYGFRGASASNLQTFHRSFAAEGIKTSDATTLSLSTSWRNPGAVLEAANVVSAPLAAKLEAETVGLSVKPLGSRAQYLGQQEDVSFSRLEVLVEETVEEEFRAVAEWMREARNSHLVRVGENPTAAVIFRSRRLMPAVSEALWKAGVPNRIVGIGGLLTTPEVTDLVSGLRCLWFADANSELIRLLAGPRFRIGVADLEGLGQAAKWFSRRDHAKQKIDLEQLRSVTPLTDHERNFTLLDALDEIAGLQDLEHRALGSITAEGRVRLREAGQVLRDLRREFSGDIPALIRAVIQALRIDIELDAAEHTGYEGSAVARANLDSFLETIESFLASDEQGTLASVLGWLERASENDELAEHMPEPEPGTVQLITAHGSKGLEWDLVAIPRLVEAEFPASFNDGMGWLRPGQLPDELRGDASARPKLNLELVDTQKQVIDRLARYQDDLKTRHSEEERRLAYVAITRAASRLLLTASFWGGQTSPREPSVFLRELEVAELTPPLPRESKHEIDPSSREGRTLLWPLDPLGKRATAVHTAADTLRRALHEDDGSDVNLHPVVELLLAERAADQAQRPDAAPPAERLTASTFHEFVENPAEAERRRLRPMPVRPYRRTRTGNLFHEWVERRVSTSYGTSLMLPGLDVDAWEQDTEVDSGEHDHDRDLQYLIEQFERSRWANLQPIAVELEITLPFAGRTLVCKLDAVYQIDSSSETRYEIVDWKSGRPPKDAQERSSRFLQLDLYRHAYARWAGIDPELIDVTLFYVAEGQELKGEGRLSFEELEQLWLGAEGSVSR